MCFLKFNKKASVPKIFKIFFVSLVVLFFIVIGQNVYAQNNFDVTYNVINDWGSGSEIKIIIKNNMTEVNGWTLEFDFPGNQVITNLWDGNYIQSGNHVSITNKDYNNIIPGNGGEISLGFIISYSGSNINPDIFIVDADIPPDDVTDPLVFYLTGGDYEFSYVIRDDWKTGTTVDIIIKNNSDINIDGWTLNFSFPGNQIITNIWNGSYAQSGKNVTINNVDYNRIIPPGGEVTLGFNASYTGKNKKPSNVIFKGVSCMNEKVTVIHGNIQLSIPAAAGYVGSKIKITPLTLGQMNPLSTSAASVVLSKDNIAGYEIELDDDIKNSFLQPITVSLKYDESKVPSGLNENAIFIFNFNVYNKKWEYILRNGIDLAENEVSSSSDNFYQIYPAVMSSPSESSGALKLNTNPVNIDSVDPMMGIKGLNPPIPNNYGSANLSYPIEVPTGVNNLTPSLSLNYSSFSGEGNCGYGWNMGVSTITLDISEGTPKYDGTDKYFLDGKELVFVGNNVYRYKNEKTFDKVVWNEYYKGFIVYKTNGTIVHYGTGSNSRFHNPDNPNQVFGWYMTYIKDKYNNYMTYEYLSRDEDDNMYLNEIKYGYEYEYIIKFNWKKISNSRNDCKRGFYILNDKILDNIYVYYKENILKRYHLNYGPGAFGKSLLNNIMEKNDTDVSFFNVTTFKYDTQIGDLFTISYWAPAFNLNGSSNQDLRYTYTNDEGAKSHTEIDFVDFNGDGVPDRVAKHRSDTNFYVQFGSGEIGGFLETVSIGSTDMGAVGQEDLRYTNKTNDKKRSHTEIDFVDFNGDGRPDKVAKHRSDTNFYVQFNTGQTVSGQPGFTETKIIGASSMGVDGYEDLRFSVSNEEGTRNHSEIDFVDFDGDGLPDRVAKKTGSDIFYVQFNNGTFSENGGFTQTIAIEAPPYDAAGYKDLRYTFTNGGDESRKSHTEIDFIDFNGDGLPDRVAKHREDPNFYVQLNLGRRTAGIGFTETKIIEAFDFDVVGQEDLRYTFSDYESTRHHTEIDFVDINGDGLPDRVAKVRGDDTYYIQFNTGRIEAGEKGFTDTIAYNSPPLESRGYEDLRYSFINGEGAKSHTEVDFVDYNGDGFPDRVAKHREDTFFYVQMNNLSNKNVLTKVITSSGAEIQLEYARYHMQNRDQQLITKNFGSKTTLYSVTVGHPDLTMNTTSIHYAGGEFDYGKRKFRGFNEVKVLNADSEKTGVIGETISYYLVGERTGEIDIAGNEIYSEYIFGQLDSVINKIKLNGMLGDEYILSKTKNIYGIASILNSNSDVKFVYHEATKVWTYNSDIYSANRFMGNDIVNGDLFEYKVYGINVLSGLIAQTSYYKYNDPYHRNDDTVVVTKMKNVTNGDNWFNNIESVEVKKLSGERLTYKSYTFNSNNSIISETAWNNNGGDFTKTYEYDSHGIVSKTTNPDGLSVETKVTYIGLDDIYKVVERKIPHKGNQTKTYFDPFGNITHNKIFITNGNDATYRTVSEFTYDDYQRLIQVKEYMFGSLFVTKNISYGISIKDGQKYYMAEAEFLNNPANQDFIKIQFFKNVLGQEAQIKTEAVIEGVKYWQVSGMIEYDSMGRIIVTGSKYTVPYSYSDKSIADFQMIEPKTFYEYDELGRNNKIIMANGLVNETETETVLDTNNIYTRILFKSTKQIIDDSGEVKQHRITYKDLSGINVKIETLKSDWTVITSTFESDLNGYSVKKEGNLGIVEKQVDSIGRLKWIKTPDMGKTEYFYNSKGFLDRTIQHGKNDNDNNSIITNYIYDNTNNNLLKIDYEGTEEDVDYEYYSSSDLSIYKKAKLKKITKGNGISEVYSYGQFYNIKTTTIDGLSYTTRYDYDVQGRIFKITYPDNEIVTYYYNESGLLKRVSGWQNYIEEILYNKNGQRSFVKYGNQTRMEYSYDDITGNLDYIILYDKNGVQISRYDYGFDSLGNIISLEESLDSILKSRQTYNIDTFLCRLSCSEGLYNDNGTNKTYSTNYNYDNDRRLLNKTIDNIEYVYNYAVNTHVLSNVVIKENGMQICTQSFNYDDYGNRIRKEYTANNNTKITDYIYNFNSQLKTVVSDNLEIEYSYDFGGNRFKKIQNDSVGVISEIKYLNGIYTIINGKIDKHISDGNHLIATLKNNNLSNINYYHSNYIGSTSAVTNENGDKVKSFIYYPYGKLWVEESYNGGSSVGHLFTGHGFDEETGLYYFKARYYDPDLGIFTSVDPALDGLNLYAYCRNNPVMYSDPTGLWSIGFGIVFSWDATHGIGLGVGFALDFRDVTNYGFGFNLSSSVYEDGSSTYTAGASGALELYIFCISGGAGVSYNTQTGYAASLSAGAGLFSLIGLELATNHYWDTDGDYRGGTYSIFGFLGNKSAYAGVGYMYGTGEFKGETGFYTEAGVMGFTFRDWKLIGYSADISITYDSVFDDTPLNEADAEMTNGWFVDSSLITDFGKFTSIGVNINAFFSLANILISKSNEVENIDVSSTGIDVVLKNAQYDNSGKRIYGQSFGAVRYFHGVSKDTNMSLDRRDVLIAYNIGRHELYHSIQYQKYGILVNLFPYRAEYYADFYGSK